MPHVNILHFYRMCLDAAIYLEVCINFQYIREMIIQREWVMFLRLKSGRTTQPWVNLGSSLITIELFIFERSYHPMLIFNHK